MTQLIVRPTPLTPAELRPIVDAWGGVDKFAAVIHARPRTVYAWLAGERGGQPDGRRVHQEPGGPGFFLISASAFWAASGSPGKENAACAGERNGVVSSLTK